MDSKASAVPELLTKKQAAELLQVSQRQIELLSQRGQIAKPVYLGERSPRWRRNELLASLGARDNAANGEGLSDE